MLRQLKASSVLDRQFMYLFIGCIFTETAMSRKPSCQGFPSDFKNDPLECQALSTVLGGAGACEVNLKTAKGCAARLAQVVACGACHSQGWILYS